MHSVIPPSIMFGRLTGNARHLSDPANRIYYATMEEGLYDVDVHTLEVRTLFHDEQIKDGVPKANLPGYHGKGLYSGQGRVIYANNGEHGPEALRNPFVPSGVLAQWQGQDWQIVARNQFTDVTGPGGISGNPHPETDPVWAIGWDARSVILMLLDGGQWHRYRLPKASHSYDGAHGWNTEWPRIRDIGEGDANWLMTMHGMFWRFPKTFSFANSSGIAPRSTYLKVVGDFCRWGDHVVAGCDDSAHSEFLNKRRAKGEIAAPQSQSNLWFLDPAQLDHLGPIIARGAVWLDDAVEAGQASDPYLFSGLSRRALHLAQDGSAGFDIEIDRRGNGTWETFRHVEVKPYQWIEFPDGEPGVWLRLKPGAPSQHVTAWFTVAGPDPCGSFAEPALFDGLARTGESGTTGGLIRALDANKRTLQFAATVSSGETIAYELGADMILRPLPEPQLADSLPHQAAIPSRAGVIEEDAASIIYTADDGKRFRLPRAGNDFSAGRLCREVATERDLFNCGGTFFELPAENAAGFCRVRPVASHHLAITDYCSYRGLLVLSGVQLANANGNRHLIRSTDGKTGLWVGAIDDLWQLGKPVGTGGPWQNSAVRAGAPSDPYLMTGYDQKTLRLSADRPTVISVQVDLTGTGTWRTWREIDLKTPGQTVEHVFPAAFQAYWIRFISQGDATASAQLEYR